MKKFYFWIITLIITFQVQAYAQNSEIRLKKLHYSNSLGEKGVTTFFYSLENKNYRAKWELLDGSKSSINYHLYNEQGKLIRKYKEFSDSTTSSNFYKYDDMGNLIEDYFERSDKIRGTVWYTYENGRKTEAECRGYNGYFWGFIKYIYENNILIKGIILKEGKETGSIEYKYDKDQNIISEFWDLGNWNQTFNYEYEPVGCNTPISFTYSSPFLKESKPFTIKEEIYIWNNEKEGISYYKYKDQNQAQLVSKIYEYEGKNTVTTFEYDDAGLLMKSTRIYSDGKKAQFYYLFSQNRKLLRRICFGDYGYFASETYTYDETGNLSEADWLKFDSWLTGTIKFNYENNILKSGFFNGKDGFNSDIIINCDEMNRVYEILWQFSFGKTQTYKFSYF